MHADALSRIEKVDNVKRTVKYQKKMKKNLNNIFQCSAGIGFGLLMPAVFLLAINKGLLKAFSINNHLIIFIAYLSIIFYLAWLSGALTSDIKGFTSITRGVLSSFFVNIFSINYFYKDLITPGKAHILFLIVLLNCLIAVYACQTGEKYSNKNDSEAEGNFFVVALGLPIPFFIFIWLIIFGLFKLYSL